MNLNVDTTAEEIQIEDWDEVTAEVPIDMLLIEVCALRARKTNPNMKAVNENDAVR